MLLAFDAILGQRSAHSFATGPVMALPFISPLLFTITPALSSKYIKTPSFLLNGFLCRITTAGITFFLSSGFPFFTVATIMSPEPAAGKRFNRPLIPWTAMTYKFLAPGIKFGSHYPGSLENNKFFENLVLTSVISTINNGADW
ncbi:hypothetical protein AAG570_010275 [Ranatra chinensis]|uniref:Uncharacterized protein n=1 Tax=Ranatra chinensis TaxID=642074 RepID=A0ABD0YP81_9HEMI